MPVVTPPSSNRGRKSRFDEATLAEMAQAVETDQFYSTDTEPVKSKATAQGRAAGARAALGSREPAVESSTRVWPADPENEDGGYFWAVGPAIVHDEAD